MGGYDLVGWWRLTVGCEEGPLCILRIAGGCVVPISGLSVFWFWYIGLQKYLTYLTHLRILAQTQNHE